MVDASYPLLSIVLRLVDDRDETVQARVSVKPWAQYTCGADKYTSVSAACLTSLSAPCVFFRASLMSYKKANAVEGACQMPVRW